MKIEKLTDNKIRIIINIEEIAEQKKTLKKANNNDNTALINMILFEAQKQVGFDVKGCKVLIDAFSTTEDYVIFTLTKYKNEPNLDNYPRKLRFKRKTLHNLYAKYAIYKFNTFDEFCHFCTYCKSSALLDLKKFAKNISLYEYKNYYYLIFSNINANFKHINLFYTSISEFSNWISDSVVLKGKIYEHGTAIFKTNAIENGIKYFANF